MKLFVAGITGQTGGAAADAALANGHEVRALVRATERARSWEARGVELLQGDLSDAEGLARALEGTDGAYLLVPPVWGAADYFAATASTIDALLTALKQHPGLPVVALSSIAVQHEQGTGPIRALRPLESGLEARPKTTRLRAAYFQENLAASLQPVTRDGVLPAFFDPSLAFEMVATRDIGRQAVELLEGGATEPVVNLAGPAQRSLTDAAAISSELLGREIAIQRAPARAVIPVLEGMGAGHLAELYGELNAAMDAGQLVFETPPAIVRGATSLEQTLRGLLQRSVE